MSRFYSTTKILNNVYSGGTLNTIQSMGEVFNAVYDESSNALKVNISGLTSGAENFTDLNDTPDDYSSQSGKFIKVNDNEDGLEYGSIPQKTEVLIDQRMYNTTIDFTKLNFNNEILTNTDLVWFDYNEKNIIYIYNTTIYFILEKSSFSNSLPTYGWKYLDASDDMNYIYISKGSVSYRSMDLGKTWIELDQPDVVGCNRKGDIVVTNGDISYDYGDTWESHTNVNLWSRDKKAYMKTDNGRIRYYLNDKLLVDFTSNAPTTMDCLIISEDNSSFSYLGRNGSTSQFFTWYNYGKTRKQKNNFFGYNEHLKGFMSENGKEILILSKQSNKHYYYYSLDYGVSFNLSSYNSNVISKNPFVSRRFKYVSVNGKTYENKQYITNSFYIGTGTTIENDNIIVGDTSNNITLDSTKGKRYIGSTSVWKDMVGDVFGKRLNSSSGKVDYDWDNNAIKFQSGGDITKAIDRVQWNQEINHEFKVGSSITFSPHIHHFVTYDIAGETPDYTLKLEYRLQRNGHLKTTSWTTLTLNKGDNDKYNITPTPDTEETYNQISIFPDITITCGISDTLQFRMARTDSNWGNMLVYFMDLHGEVDSDGSDDEYTKNY